MAKNAYRARNWRQYNEALVQRGSVTFWFSEEIIKDWHVNDSKKSRGRPRKYSDLAIQCGLTLKALFKLTFRAVEGFIKSLLERLKIEVKAPDYSLLCKRQHSLQIHSPKRKSKEALHILVDGTGLKIFGEGEWKVRQHGYTKRRTWRKLHLAINANTQEIEAFQLTESTVPDGDALPSLIEQINEQINTATGDGAYDQYKSYKLARKKQFTLITPPKRDAKLTGECTGYSTRQKHTSETLNALQQRDNYIKRIRAIGRAEWKNEVSYHRRSLVETAMFRLKTLLGATLSARTLENQRVEVAIWCSIINQMTSLEMPHSIRVN